MRTWIDGHLLPDPAAPAVRADDHGLTVGDGVFEAVKVVRGVPFALTRHLDRLRRSAAALGLPEPDSELVRVGIAAVVRAEEELARVRITMTGGPAPLGSGRGDVVPTYVVSAEAIAPSPATGSVVTVPWPRNERGALAGVKSTSYGENVVALAYAARHGAGEAVFGNLAGNLCEGTGSNVFYVCAGELRTPTLASGCLAGVSRALLLAWAPEVVATREVDEPLACLTEATEVLLTSTTRDVQVVTRVDDRDVEPGPVGRALAALWQRREAETAEP